MAISVVMPALELAQESGKLLAWLKQEGDDVAKGEMIAEIETDKAVFELEAPGDGVLAGVKSTAGDMVPVGQTIAWIVARGETPPEDGVAEAAARAMKEQARPSSATAAAPPAPSVPSRGAVAGAPAAKGPGRASPKARRIAEEHGIDISQIRGTGPDGSITGEDVLAAAAAAKQAPKPAPVSTAPTAASTPAAASTMSAVARLMAERTTQSWTQTPHFFLVREIDAGGLLEARKKLGEGYTITDLLISITARALTKHPKLNASWTAEGIHLNPDINVTIAIAVDDGVAGAVIPKADTASLADIAGQRKQLAERARAGRLRPSDVAGGTFTISNLGMFNVDAFNAIITPPQAAILAVGRISDRVVPVNGAPGIRPMLTLTLSSDHRVVDGAQAARFLNDLCEALTQPQA
jgi:pyruvate dehydrogenase E2 component (dihydrolipoamide acetyltransferase)